MSNFRAPSLLAKLGYVSCGLALLCILLLGLDHWSSLALMILAIGPIFEAGNWNSACRIASLYYDRDADRIGQEAYSPVGAWARSAFFCAWAAAALVLGRGGLDLVPDNVAAVLTVLLTPLAVYLVWAGLAYWRDIRAAAERAGWQRARANRKG